MKILTPGHLYELKNVEDNTPTQSQFIPGQLIQFIQKEKRDEKFVTVQNGTTNEEVLAVLIDRVTSMNKAVPSRENSLAITNLEQALMWLEKRTRDRVARAVEGTPNA